jgi:drug/metabolite transporter (DMT)-like permease
METSAPKLHPRAAVIVGVFFTSFSSILVRLSLAPPQVIATYRLGITVLILTPAFIKRARCERDWLNGNTLILCIASGVFLAFHFHTWFVSLRHTTVAASTILVNIHPLFIVLGSLLILGERVERRTLPFIGMTVLGSIFISLGDWNRGGQSLFGDSMAVLGALCVSGYILIGRVVRQRMSLPLYTFTVYGSSTVVLLLVDLLTGAPLFPYPPREFLIFAALALVCTIGGHTLLNWALRYVEPSFVSTAVLGEPVFASLMALLVFSEVPSWYVLAGGAVVIAGIYLFIRVGRRPEVVRTWGVPGMRSGR